MPELTVIVYGTPAPQGSKRVARGRVIEMSAKVRPWRDAIMRACYEARVPLLCGPVEADITFYVPRPAGHLRADGSLKESARPYPSVVPDLDKYIRSTLDGLAKDAGVIRDDCRVVALAARKLYADGVAPGAVICLRELEAVR